MPYTKEWVGVGTFCALHQGVGRGRDILCPTPRSGLASGHFVPYTKECVGLGNFVPCTKEWVGIGTFCALHQGVGRGRDILCPTPRSG